MTWRGAVRQAQAQRAAFVEAVEQAFDPGAAGGVGGQSGAGRMGGGEPARADRREALVAPAPEPAGEALGQGVEEQGRIGRSAEHADADRRARGLVGMVGEIDSEADDDRVVDPLEQDARQLGAGDQQIVGPFDLDRAPAGDEGGGDLVQRHRGDQRQGRRRRIAGAKPDERAGVEIAGRRMPFPPLPAAAAGLALGAQPDPLGRALAGERGEVVVGRAGLGDGADGAHRLRLQLRRSRRPWR